MASEVSPIDAELPDVDDRLIAPETRYEIIDGELVYRPPADRLRGSRHAELLALAKAHAGAELQIACDLLTRTSETSDIAPNVSVLPRAPDPRTGGRQIEQLAFEIVSTDALAYAGRKAAKLVARGVRRVFAIDVERSCALEWSAALGTWTVLEDSAAIEDSALAVALPIAALIGISGTDDAIARALLIKRNPVLEAALAYKRAQGEVEGRLEVQLEDWLEGRLEGMTRGLLVLLAARGISVDDAARDRILGERDSQRLERWIAGAATCTTIAEILTGDRAGSR